MASLVVLPAIPYQGPIPGGLHEGKRIEVNGSVPYGADSFSVNLATGLDSRSDRLLHLGVRFNGRIVVRNSLQMMRWGAEERGGPFPFIQGADFTISILINPACYFISVNGSHCWRFNHRLPLARASTLLIDGRVTVKTIQFIDKNTNTYQPQVQPQVVCPVAPVNPGYIVLGNYPSVSTPAYVVPPPQNPYPYTPSLNLQPVYNPTIPFSYIIPGGISPGMMIYVSGRPHLLANDWTINLQSSTRTHPPPDIAFHLGVRHHSRTVVRNTRVNNLWEWEETGLPRTFPFEAMQDFHLLIRIEPDKIRVALDNAHLLEFRHRLKPLSRFECLYIERDVRVTAVRIE